MTIAWLIGLILSLLGIYLFKGSRVKAVKRSWGEVIRPERPVLKVWSTFLFILGALVPILNIIMAGVMISFWAMAVYNEKDWLYKEGTIVDKFVKLLNKPIE